MSVVMENLMPIGEFAAASRLSQKALRLYGEIRCFLCEPSVERLDAYEREIADEFAERRRVLRYVKRILGEQCQFPEILGAYDAVYHWVKQNGREASGPSREIYLSGPGGVEQLQIAVPLA